MEPSGRKRWQTIEARRLKKPLEIAQLFATGCHRSLSRRRGKEGVNDSSLLEGFAIS